MLNELLGITKCGSVHGEVVDAMLEIVHWFMLVLGVGWTVFLVYVFARYHRRRNPKANYHGVRGHASSHIEVGVVIVEAILLLGFAFPLWGRQVDEIPVDADVQVRAIAQQYNWTFHYAGKDGRFGNTHPHFYSSKNNAGIDPDDPNGKDDLIANELWVPTAKKVVVGVTSKDVIHNLALKRARVATDATPGTLNRVWFIPTETGKSEIICGQLCGGGHGSMLGIMNIVTEKEYAEWLGEQTTFGSTLAAPPAAPAQADAAPAAPAPTDKK